MLQTTTIKFLKELKKNNNREWFDVNRKLYENAKADFLNLVNEVLHEMQLKDSSLQGLEPKQCVFRINRDVRFSKDKSPYKSNMGTSFNKGGKKSMLAGYYFQLEPGCSFIAGGIWMPLAAELKKVRQEIDYNFDEFQKIISSKKFVAQFGDIDKTQSLIRPPKGYDEANEAIEYLKLKSFITHLPVEDETLTQKDLVKKIVTAFDSMQPLIHFLNRGIES